MLIPLLLFSTYHSVSEFSKLFDSDFLDNIWVADNKR